MGWCRRKQKRAPQKSSVITKLILSFIPISRPHASRQNSSTSQVQRKTCCGIWCLLKEINKQEQALGKAVLTAIPPTAVISIAPLNHLHHNHQHQRLPWCSRPVSASKQVHECSLLYSACSHTHKFVCKHAPTPCLPPLQTVDATAASRLSKHHKATASSDSAESENECVRVCVFIVIYHLEGHFRCIYGGRILKESGRFFLAKTAIA